MLFRMLYLTRIVFAFYLSVCDDVVGFILLLFLGFDDIEDLFLLHLLAHDNIVNLFLRFFIRFYKLKFAGFSFVLTLSSLSIYCKKRGSSVSSARRCLLWHCTRIYVQSTVIFDQLPHVPSYLSLT